jgi:hypothetical protein
MKYKAIHDIKPRNDKASKMFENPILDKLTSSHAAIPISMLVLFGIGFLYWGTQHTLLNNSQYIILVLAGIVSWTLFEYLMHKHLYHMLPTNKIRGWIQYNMHGIHHEYPKDKSRLAMPPLAIIVIAFMFLFVFRLIMDDFAFGFAPGFLFGYAG